MPRPSVRAAADGRTTPTLWTVQALRAAAAMLVVIGHSQSMTARLLGHAGFARSTALPWGAGVDLFFVISGFIMVHASRRLFGTPGAWAAFLRRRLIRIVPPYWLATTVYLVILAWAAARGGEALPPPAAVAASYLFLPYDTFGVGLFPVFDLGWTLEYEMAFYAVFAATVALPRERALLATVSLLAVAVAVGVELRAPTAFWFWTRPIICDFALGLVVGGLVSAAVALPVTVRFLIGSAAVAVLVADPTGLFAGPLGTTVDNGWARVLWAGLPAALLLAALLLGPEPQPIPFARPVAALGDASYSLYLFHPFALIVMAKLAQKWPPLLRLPGGIIVVATVILATVVALLVYRWLEQPVTAGLARRFSPDATVPPPLEATALPSHR